VQVVLVPELSYKDQWDMLKAIKLREGQYLRLDCPVCKGLNCFGIERNGGVVSWGCFRASCGAKGKHDVGFTREGIRVRLGYDQTIRSSNDEPKPIPDPLVSIDTRPYILDWLSSVNTLAAYNNGLVDITYSPTEDRVMFKIPNVKGYVGRNCATLENSRVKAFGPKWRNYGDTSTVFSCGKGGTGVIVEDAPSACAVGTVDGLTGIALLGTKLTTAHKVALRKYKKLIVCLDKDAALKSIEFSRRLSGTSNVSVKMIPDDLKYFNPTQIEGMLCGLSTL
jgi:hypothetical protein